MSYLWKRIGPNPGHQKLCNNQNWKNKLKISSAMNKMEKINWRYLVEKRTVKVQGTTDSFSNNGGGKYWKKLLEPACQRNQLGDGTLQFLKTFGAGPLEQEGLKIKPAQDLMPFCHFCYFEMLSFDTFGVFAAGWLLNKSDWWKEAGPKERIFTSRFVFRRQPVKVLSKIIHQSNRSKSQIHVGYYKGTRCCEGLLKIWGGKK